VPTANGYAVHVSDASEQGTPTTTPPTTSVAKDPNKDSNNPDNADDDDSHTTLGESQKDDNNLEDNANKNPETDPNKDSNNVSKNDALNGNKASNDEPRAKKNDGESKKNDDDDWVDEKDDGADSKPASDDDESFLSLGPAEALKARREKKRKLNKLSNKKKPISTSDDDDEDEDLTSEEEEEEEFDEEDDEDDKEEQDNKKSKPPPKKKRQQWIERPAGVRPVRASQQVDRTARGKIKAMKKPMEMLWKMTIPHAKSNDFDPNKHKATGQIRAEKAFPWVIHGAFSYMEQGPNANGGSATYLDTPQLHFAVGSEQAAHMIQSILHGTGPNCDIHIHYKFDNYERSFYDENLKKKKGKKEEVEEEE
jgi:hypothetical protein